MYDADTGEGHLTVLLENLGYESNSDESGRKNATSKLEGGEKTGYTWSNFGFSDNLKCYFYCSCSQKKCRLRRTNMGDRSFAFFNKWLYSIKMLSDRFLKIESKRD